MAFMINTNRKQTVQIKTAQVTIRTIDHKQNREWP
jgi:hypothetical protein